jgi:hypothetical protein
MAGFGHRSSAEIQSLPSRRLFNNNYDSLEQKRRAKELRKAFVAYRRGVTAELPDVNDLLYAELLGRVRMDLVLSGTLVLTDAQLLDGALFMRVAADEFLSDLEIPGLTGSPIEIMRRGDSLAESLVAMLNRKGVAKPFEFSCLSTADSQRVYAELRRLQDEGLPGPTDLDGIDALFTGCRVPKRVREHLRQSWDSWDSMASSGRLPARKWEGDYLVDRAIEDANKTAKEDIRLATGPLVAGGRQPLRPSQSCLYVSTITINVPSGCAIGGLRARYAARPGTSPIASAALARPSTVTRIEDEPSSPDGSYESVNHRN